MFQQNCKSDGELEIFHIEKFWSDFMIVGFAFSPTFLFLHRIDIELDLCVYINVRNIYPWIKQSKNEIIKIRITNNNCIGFI